MPGGLMAHIFVNTLKWLISVSFFILGVFSLRWAMADNTVSPMFVVVFSFGIVYWMSKTTYEASKKLFLTGLGVVLVAGLASRWIVWPYITLDLYGLGYYMTWELCTLVVGIPVMGYLFWKER